MIAKLIIETDDDDGDSSNIIYINKIFKLYY